MEKIIHTRAHMHLICLFLNGEINQILILKIMVTHEKN